METRNEMEARHNEAIATMEFLHGGLPSSDHPYWQTFRDETDAMDQREADSATEIPVIECEAVA